MRRRTRARIAANPLYQFCKRLVRGPEISHRKVCEFLEAHKDERLPVRTGNEVKAVTIVVPCYAHASYIGLMFDSIEQQSRLPEEVIFVDDCSPDATSEILQQRIAAHTGDNSPRYLLLRNECNLGQSSSLNRAIAAAQSELIMILNDDDYLCHDTVEMALMLFSRYPDVFLIGGHSIQFSDNADLNTGRKKIAQFVEPDRLALSVQYPEDVLHYRRYRDLNMTHSGSCFLKSAWECVGGYQPDKGKRLVPFSDRDFQLRVNALFPVGISPDVPFSFWRSNSSVDNGLDS